MPGGVSTGSGSINNQRTVVGGYAIAMSSGPYNFQLFLRAAYVHDVRCAKSVFCVGLRCQLIEWVVGNYQDANYVTHGFLHPSSN